MDVIVGKRWRGLVVFIIFWVGIIVDCVFYIICGGRKYVVNFRVGAFFGVFLYLVVVYDFVRLGGV